MLFEKNKTALTESTHKATEHRLALAIAASVLGVLSVIIVSISVSFYFSSESGDHAVLTNWIQDISKDSRLAPIMSRATPSELETFFRDARRLPPQFRNIIVYFNSGEMVIRGPLEFLEAEESLDIPQKATSQLFSKEIQGRKYILLGKNYRDRAIYVYASPDGELARFPSFLIYFAISCILFAIGIYILSRKFANELFAPMRESLEVMGLYNRNIAHELRTPLAVLKSDLELIGDKQKNEHLKSALEEVDSIRGIIDGLLFLAENRKLENTKVIDVGVLARSKWETLKKLMPKKLEISIEANATIRGEPELIKILFGILLENAFTHASAPSTVSVYSDERGIILKNDTTAQIPESILAHIFEPFLKFNSGGSGLGLALARKIVDIHGGKITMLQKERSIEVVVCIPESKL